MTNERFSKFYGFTESDIKDYFLENLIRKDAAHRDEYINNLIKLMK